MTELFIAGISVVLPKDMNLEVKRENPLFTKNGEYTYDLTLSLENKINADLYKHLNRLNSVDEITEARKAILIADNCVYCNGIEIIEGWTNTSVSIQVASGNSEFNYFIGSDILISSLKLNDTSITPDVKFVQKRYPEIEYCLAPIVNGASGILYNEWRLNYVSSQAKNILQPKPDHTKSDYIPQPFLCAFIKRLLAAIGYNLFENAIEKTVWKDLYISHLNSSTEWANIVPGWKVSDFLNEVEALFNVTFAIDSKERTVRLLFNNTYYVNANISHVTSVIDDYETEVDKENQSLQQNSNVKYGFPENSYFRRRCLPEQIKNTATRKIIPKDYATDESGIYLLMWFETNKDPQTIYTDERTGRDLIAREKNEGGYISHYEIVDEFKGIERGDGATQTLEIGMMPVALKTKYWYVYLDGVRQWNHVLDKVPVIEDSGSTPEEEEEKSLDTMLEEGYSENSESKSPIYLAFHYGLNNKEGTAIPKKSFPIPFTDDKIITLWVYEDTNNDGATLRLDKFEQELYNSSYSIDESKAYNITSYDPNLFDTRTVFEIRNKYYVCKEIKYLLGIEGRKKPWTGIFYPIKISDVEVNQRWILEDGKWRDGGVWLENGRWLDE